MYMIGRDSETDQTLKLISSFDFYHNKQFTILRTYCLVFFSSLEIRAAEAPQATNHKA